MLLTNRLHILPEIIIGASTSIHVFLSKHYPLNNLHLDSGLFDLVDSRLDLKIIISDTNNSIDKSIIENSELLQSNKWDIRFVKGASKCNFVIVDDQTAFVTQAPNDELNYTGTQVYGVDDPIDWFRLHFDMTWVQSVMITELLYENIHSIQDITRERQQILNNRKTWDRIIENLSHNPHDLHRLKPRQFEELICELFNREGMEATLTQQTHDGGKDIIVHSKDHFGSHLYLVECKKFSPTRAISVDIIRSLYGVVEENKASGGLIITTSYFSREALKLHQKLQYRLDLKAYKNLCNWLNKHNIYS